MIHREPNIEEFNETLFNYHGKQLKPPTSLGGIESCLVLVSSTNVCWIIPIPVGTERYSAFDCFILVQEPSKFLYFN